MNSGLQDVFGGRDQRHQRNQFDIRDQRRIRRCISVLARIGIEQFFAIFVHSGFGLDRDPWPDVGFACRMTRRGGSGPVRPNIA